MAVAEHLETEKKAHWTEQVKLDLEAANERIKELEAQLAGQGGNQFPPYIQVQPGIDEDSDTGEFLPGPVIRTMSDASIANDGFFRYSEEITFAPDSGYDPNIYTRAIAWVGRAVGESKVGNHMTRLGQFHTVVGSNGIPQQVWAYDKLPKFDPSNKMRLTLEFIGKDE